MILAMSSLIPIGNPTDKRLFETALRLLHSMSANGNLAASEFSSHLDQIKVCLYEYVEKNIACGDEASSRAAVIETGVLILSSPVQYAQNDCYAGDFTTTTNGTSDYSSSNASRPTEGSIGGYTAEMALLEPTMEDFLAQSDFDLGFPLSVDSFTEETDALYTYLTSPGLSQ